jgi:RimJ/RimL family protein N-acetyltransferase
MFTADRFTLRAATVDDADGFDEMMSDPELHLASTDSPFLPRSPERTRHWLSKYEAREKNSMFVAEAADGRFLGMCSLWGVDALHRFGHVGILLRSAARGQGYGTAMVRLTCRYGFRIRNLRRLELETRATNIPMRRAAEACGFRHEATLRGREWGGDGPADIALYGMLRTEWSG